MTPTPACAARRLLPLLLALTLSGCALLQGPSPSPSPPVLPALPASLTTDDSADSLDYSSRVRSWLQRAADALSSSPPKRPACSETPPRSGGCS